jgi:hypothetical protein
MRLYFAIWDLGYPKGYPHYYTTHLYKTYEARERFAKGRPWFDFDTETGKVEQTATTMESVYER